MQVDGGVVGCVDDVVDLLCSLRDPCHPRVGERGGDALPAPVRVDGEATEVVPCWGSIQDRCVVVRLGPADHGGGTVLSEVLSDENQSIRGADGAPECIRLERTACASLDRCDGLDVGCRGSAQSDWEVTASHKLEVHSTIVGAVPGTPRGPQPQVGASFFTASFRDPRPAERLATHELREAPSIAHVEQVRVSEGRNVPAERPAFPLARRPGLVRHIMESDEVGAGDDDRQGVTGLMWTVRHLKPSWSSTAS